MNFFEFLLQAWDSHPIVLGLILLLLIDGFSKMLSNIFYNKHKAEVDKEHEKRFWK